MTVGTQASSHKLQWTMKPDCTILNQNVSNIKGNMWYDIQNSKVCHLLEDSRLQIFGNLWTSQLHENSELWIPKRLNAYLHWVSTTNKMSKVLLLHDNGGMHTSHQQIFGWTCCNIHPAVLNLHYQINTCLVPWKSACEDATRPTIGHCIMPCTGDCKWGRVAFWAGINTFVTRQKKTVDKAGDCTAK
jgi:hypothetical protein